MVRNSLVFRLLTVLLVVCLIFQISPIRAEALVWELVVVDAVLAFLAIVGALGVAKLGYNIASSDEFVGGMDSIKEFIVDGDKVELRTQMVDGYTKYYADAAMIAAVREWLFNSGLIQTESVVNFGSGVALVHSNNIGSEYDDFWGSIDLFTTAGLAAIGEVIMLSARSPELPTIAYGLQRLTTDYGLDVLQLRSASSIAPYTTSDFPVGEFVNLSAFSDTYTSRMNYGYSYGSYAETIFLSYEDAVVAYNNPLINQDYYFYLTPESYFIPVASSASSTGFSNVSVSRIANLGRLSSGGQVEVSTFDISPGSGYNDYRYIFVPLSYAEEKVNSSILGVTGYLPDPSLPMMDAYQSWWADTFIRDQVVYAPIGLPADSDTIQDMTQEQFWSGNICTAVPVVDRPADADLFPTYQVGEKPDPLFAKAYSPDGGRLLYQWYCNGFPLTGEVTALCYPSTDQVGVFSYVCAVTNITATDHVGAVGSTWTWTVTVTEAGSDVIPTVPPGVHAGEHTFTSTVVKAPTCTSTGININTCTICGTVYTETVAALEHTWVLSDAAASVATYECAVCAETKAGYSVSDSIGGMSSMMGDFNDSIGGFINQANRFSVFLAGLIPAFHGDALSLVWLSLSAVVIMAVWRKWFK